MKDIILLFLLLQLYERCYCCCYSCMKEVIEQLQLYERCYCCCYSCMKDVIVVATAVWKAEWDYGWIDHLIFLFVNDICLYLHNHKYDRIHANFCCLPHHATLSINITIVRHCTFSSFFIVGSIFNFLPQNILKTFPKKK